MKKTAAKDRKRLRLAAVLALSMALLLPGVGEASRTLPPALGAKVAPPITTAQLLNFSRPDAPAARRFALLSAENCLSFAALSVVGSADTACFSAPSHFKLFDLPSPIDRLVELELGPKTAYRRFFGPTKRIYRQTRGLRLDLHQGVYFLQPDPLGPVDSPNLYQGFGFDALNVRDPWGLEKTWAQKIAGRIEESIVRAAAKDESPIPEIVDRLLLSPLTIGLHIGEAPGRVYSELEGTFQGHVPEVHSEQELREHINAFTWDVLQTAGDLAVLAPLVGKAVTGGKACVAEVGAARDAAAEAESLIPLADEFPTPELVAADTPYYRYVGEQEAETIRRTGRIPNVDATGEPKDVYITDRYYKTAGRAKTHLQLPRKPVYRVRIEPENVPNRTPFLRVRPKDHPDWGIGGGTEAITPDEVVVDPSALERLKGSGR